MVISQETIAEVRRRCDIVEVIGAYTTLTAKGRHFSALCPFHPEKTPSFTVNPQKQVFYCFGCGAGGDLFSFVMRREQMSFQEAVKLLADRAGVVIASGSPASRKEQSEYQARKEQMYRAHQVAAEFYRQQLMGPSGGAAREYLSGRGIYNNAVSKFGLGYAPPGWDNLLEHLTRQGYKPALLSEAGLISARQQGSGYYDRFRHRLILPIINEHGQVHGFGGRAFGDEQPKYLNSPESPIYHKGKGLYGLNLAKAAIKQTRQAILVEGYFDLISAHMHGFENVAATLGTALTADQVQLLKRLGAEEVVIFFDTDPAGLAAAVRSWGAFLESGLQVMVATLGELAQKEDPDSFLRKNGAEAFRSRLNLASSLIEFVLEQALKSNPVDSADGQINCLNQVLPVLACVKNPISRCNYLKILEAKLKITDKILLEELKKVVAKGASRLKKPEAELKPAALKAPQLAERTLLKVLLESEPVAEQLAPQMEPEMFSTPAHRTLFELIKHNLAGGMSWQAVDFMQQLQDEAVKTSLSALLVGESEYNDDPFRVAQDCIRTLEASKLKAKSDVLKEKWAGNKDEDDLLREYQRLQQRIKMGNGEGRG